MTTPLRCCFSSLVWLMAAVSSVGATERRVEGGRVKAVTVFPTGALVKREATVDLVAGVNRVTLTDLPDSLIAETLQVSGQAEASVMILDVRVAQEHRAESQHERLRELEARLNELNDNRTALQNRVQVLNESKAYLDGIRSFNTTAPEEGPTEAVSPETWRERIAFNEQESARILTAQLEVQQERRELEPKIAAVERDIRSLQSGSGRTVRVVAVQLDAEAATTFHLEVEYMVDDASWSPTYLVRVDQEREELELAVKGVVEQTSGEDWSDVSMTLSTARPQLGQEPPSMDVWRLEPLQSFPVAASVSQDQSLLAYTSNSVVSGIRGNFSGAPPELADKAKAASRLEALASGDIASAQFALPYTVSLPSGDNPQTVTMATLKAPCTIYHWALPKVADVALLKARADNPATFPLLPGRTQVFLNDRFVAGSEIDYLAPGEELNFLLGPSPTLKVDRELVNNLTETVGFGGKTTRQTYDYQFKIENHDDKGTLLILRDQIPVSSHEDIEVKLLEPSAKQVEVDEAGTVLWRLDLAPREQRTVRFRFQVDHPSDLVVSGL